MNTRQMHHLFADDMWAIEQGPLTDEEKAMLTKDFTQPARPRAHRALPLPAERAWVAPQGRIEQGWPARRCSSEPIVIDRLPEAYDADDQSESADGVLLWFFIAVMLAIACGYCVAKYLAAAYV